MPTKWSDQCNVCNGWKADVAQKFENCLSTSRGTYEKLDLHNSGRRLAILGEANAGEIAGPGRFCGYSPIIDLIAGERVITLQGGIHAGSFRWEGKFGSLEVIGIDWASRPEGSVVKAVPGTEPQRFAQRRVGKQYSVAIWNGANGAANFKSEKPFTKAQLAAIDRVTLFEEGQTPSGCGLRTVFSWE